MKTPLILTRLCTAAVFMVFLTACQSSNVMVDYDTDANFSAFHYYDWDNDSQTDSQTDNSLSLNPLMLERTKTAVDNALFTLFLNRATKETPADILIRLNISSETYNQEPNSRASIGFGSGGNNSAIGVGLSLPIGGDTIINETRIVIDMIGVGDNKLKWRGSNTIKISDQSAEEITSLMNDAVAKIFSHYPPS